ncbi:hypothetical protein Agub_g2004 [Astrephomene gubernaculifera]|uniref:EGF-like domain-containing protein n=1 Tax=Astrephomene gubernaculifera TaxID=47775 RepID=A0AAD3DGD8_9CHLO|nr:hypothetical protein Agub_g2004 [Astrephomene gubernaculifera]
MSVIIFNILALTLFVKTCTPTPVVFNFSSCPELCYEHGTCNPETKRCECPLVRHGFDCSIPLSDPNSQCKAYSHNSKSCDSRDKTLCLNSCNGQGWCEGGFCHCKPGFYGADCSLSTGADGRPQLLAGQGYVPRREGPKIYVYELPPLTNTWVYIARVDRPLVQLLMQRLLSSGVRTANGDEADYFFIPFLIRTRTHAAGHLAATLHYVRQHWPWWERHGGGHRHLLVATGDLGRRGLPAELLPLSENCTFLTHWGLHASHAIGRWEASHRPGKDIVVPPLTNPDDIIVYSPLHPLIRRTHDRTKELFFAGRICGDNQKPVNGTCSDKRRDYSGNTRQQVSQHHWNRTHWTITTQSQGYVLGLSTHKFCLAPTGGGYGRRSVQALIMGCIPVTLTDGVHQPFEPELRWADFSVSVPERDIGRLHEVLGALSEARIETMQERIRCAAQHMYFSSTFGEVMGEDGRYDAFETLMEVLRMRRDYPGVDPSQYTALDKRFADFVNCQLEPTGGRVPLCTQNRLAKGDDLHHCRESYMQVPMRWMHMFYSWPGGAVCGKNPNVAKCPRSWL